MIPSVGEERLSALLRRKDLGKMAIATMTTDLDRDSRVFLVQSIGSVAGRMAGELMGTLL